MYLDLSLCLLTFVSFCGLFKSEILTCLFIQSLKIFAVSFLFFLSDFIIQTWFLELCDLNVEYIFSNLLLGDMCVSLGLSLLIVMYYCSTFILIITLFIYSNFYRVLCWDKHNFSPLRGLIKSYLLVLS